MVNPYQQPPPQYRARPSVLTWLPAALMGVVALAGLLCTLLPLWTVPINPADFQSDLQRELDGLDEEMMMDGIINVDVGFYDWTVSTTPVVFVIPLALAVAAAIAVVQLVRGSDRTLWGAAAAMVVSALLLAVSALISPEASIEVTGPLADELSTGDLDDFSQGSGLDVGFGSGLVIAVIALVLVLGLAVWQYFAAGRPARPKPVQQQWYPPTGAPTPYGY